MAPTTVLPARGRAPAFAQARPILWLMGGLKPTPSLAGSFFVGSGWRRRCHSGKISPTMPRRTKLPDASLTVQHPHINEAWFVARLERAAGELHAAHWNKWACEQLERLMGKSISQSVLTRRLKGRNKWTLDFTAAMARLLKVDVELVMAHVGDRPPHRTP
jgi:hypothetical protein